MAALLFVALLPGVLSAEPLHVSVAAPTVLVPHRYILIYLDTEFSAAFEQLGQHAAGGSAIVQHVNSRLGQVRSALETVNNVILTLDAIEDLVLSAMQQNDVNLTNVTPAMIEDAKQSLLGGGGGGVAPGERRNEVTLGASGAATSMLGGDNRISIATKFTFDDQSPARPLGLFGSFERVEGSGFGWIRKPFRNVASGILNDMGEPVQQAKPPRARREMNMKNNITDLNRWPNGRWTSPQRFCFNAKPEAVDDNRTDERGPDCARPRAQHFPTTHSAELFQPALPLQASAPGDGRAPVASCVATL